MNLTQTKTIPPEVGTYTVLPTPRDRAKGRMAGTEIVRLRHVLPADVARTLHRSPEVVRELVFVPSVPALVEGDRDFVPESDMAAARARLARWRASR